MLESIKMLQHTNLLKELYCNTLQTTAQILTPLERAGETKVTKIKKTHAYQKIIIIKIESKEKRTKIRIPFQLYRKCGQNYQVKIYKTTNMFPAVGPVS